MALRVAMAARHLFALSSSALGMPIISYHIARRHKATGRTEEEVVSLFEKWLVEHNKSYNTPGEKDKRFQIFKDRLRFIDKVNSANLSHTVGLNQFSDLTMKEFSARYLGNRYDALPDSVDGRKEGAFVPVKGGSDYRRVGRRLRRTPSNRYTPRVGDALPDSVDGRKEGAVVPVKD